VNIGHIKPSLLLSLSAQPMKWDIVLGELCDNAFDADASSIEIKFGPGKSLQVIDDGNGCDNIQKMLTIGEHYRQSTTSLGRWGVGLKEAACWLWGELHLKTVHRGRLAEIRVDWPALSKQDDWNIPDPVLGDADGVLGTQLHFRRISKWPSNYEHLQTELGHIFAPALWAGKQIKIQFARKKPMLCAGWKMPDIEDIVQDRFEVNGKRVKLTAGVVALGAQNPRKGFNFCHGHRIILNSAFGAKGISVSRICGTVELDASWKLAKNKNDLVDDDNQGLEDAIFQRCEAILKKSAEQAQLLRNSELEFRVTESLQSLLVNSRKAKRKSPENNSGPIEPKRTNRTHKRARRTQPGQRFVEECNIGQIRMEWETRIDGVIGRFDGHGEVVYLNSEHPRLAFHKHSENTEALVDTCLTVLVFEAIHSEQREKFPFGREYENFIDGLSCVLNAQQSQQEAEKAKHQNQG
jgi:hypothetical protein